MDIFAGHDLIRRYENNPILTANDFPASYHIAHCFNSGITQYNGQYIMLCRVEDIGLKAYFWVAESSDGIHFVPRSAPVRMPVEHPAWQKYASINHYDPRITQIDGVYYIMHACHSAYDCRISLFRTTNWDDFEWMGFVSDPGNRNGALFPEKINGYYARLDRPVTSWDGGDMWISFSPDLIHWGQSECIMRNSAVRWAWSKVGAGAVPIKTDAGWLNIFHGVRTQCKSHYVYQLGVCLHALDDPTRIIACCEKPILRPIKAFELVGQTPSVVFTSGAVVETNGDVKIYYGGADTVQCLAFSTIRELVDMCHNRIG
jgi:predicted GH43/DUF377 family glycosyl hydrolase